MASSPSSTSATTDETPAICQSFQAYAKAFETLKPRQVLKFYDYPAMLMKTGTKPRSFGNPIAGLIIFFLLMQDLRKQQYQRSQMTQLKVTQLSADLALVSGQASRINLAGEVFESFGFTYTMRKTHKGWKIIVGTIHNIETILRNCETAEVSGSS